ncbi:hypothetical protein [Thalassobacillus devorans]|uniref:hypothetical protein n=1 Tax=Thalassobacillus devorans TaxID=279813 RepID=UPI000A1C7F46|nr:hypothetical protein [Thalassobacillus devorans]
MIVTAENYYEQLKDFYEDITVKFKALNAMQSRLDKEVSATYHEIEKAPLDRADSYDFIVRLKDTLQKRRAVKDELVKLQPMYDLLRHNFGQLTDEYLRRCQKSSEVRSAMNSTLPIEEVLGR